MKKVSFTEMKHGTKEDYLLLDKHEKEFIKKTPDRILKYMSGFTSSHNDLQCSVHTSNRSYRPILIHPWAIRPAATAVTINWSIIADMDISDTATIDIKVSGGTKVVDLHGDGTYQSQFTCFGGSLLA